MSISMNEFALKHSSCCYLSGLGNLLPIMQAKLGATAAAAAKTGLGCVAKLSADQQANYCLHKVAVSIPPVYLGIVRQ